MEIRSVQHYLKVRSLNLEQISRDKRRQTRRNTNLYFSEKIIILKYSHYVSRLTDLKFLKKTCFILQFSLFNLHIVDSCFCAKRLLRPGPRKWECPSVRPSVRPCVRVSVRHRFSRFLRRAYGLRTPSNPLRKTSTLVSPDPFENLSTYIRS